MRQALTLRGNTALLTRANPVAKFAAVVFITAVLALSIDWVSATTALLGEFALFGLAGLTLHLLWQRGWPLLLAAALGGWSTTSSRRTAAGSCSIPASGPSAKAPSNWGSVLCCAVWRSRCRPSC